MEYLKSWWYGPSYIFGPGRAKPDAQKIASLGACTTRYVAITQEELLATISALRPVRSRETSCAEEYRQVSVVDEIKNIFAQGGPTLRHIE